MTPATDLARLADHPELAVLVTQGTEYWRSGQIRLAVNGVGVAEVDHRRSGEFRRYSERLSREEIEQLAADLTALGFTELESSRGEYQPDEQTVTLELRKGDDVLHHADLPAGDREIDARLDRLMTLWNALVERVTDGDLPRGSAAAPR